MQGIDGATGSSSEEKDQDDPFDLDIRFYSSGQFNVQYEEILITILPASGTSLHHDCTSFMPPGK